MLKSLGFPSLELKVGSYGRSSEKKEKGVVEGEEILAPKDSRELHQGAFQLEKSVIRNEQTEPPVVKVDLVNKFEPDLDIPQTTFALSPVEFKPTLSLFWPVTPSRWETGHSFKQIYDKVRETCLPNYMGARIMLKSGLQIEEWKRELVNYVDVGLVDFLQYGWPLDYTAPYAPTPVLKNHEKNTNYLAHVDTFISKEMSCDALLGPFKVPPFRPWLQISPIMTRPKKDTSARRIVIDLSFPKGVSVNSGITRGWYQGLPFSFSLPTILDLVERVKELGRGCWIWSVDLERAYRQLRVCPLSIPLLGIKFNDNIYLDLAPPFGCRMSALACARTTAGVVWILEKRGVWSKCYLDDFVGVEKRKVTADRSYRKVEDVAKTLGLDLSPHKCVAPATVVTWLGYTVDTRNMTVALPEQKIQEALELCSVWLKKEEATRKELRSLFGKLKHIATCIVPANRFLSRILDALKGTPFKGSHPLPSEIKKDISWFIESAKALNGVFLIPPKVLKEWRIECDSSLLGGGAFSPTHFYSEVYKEDYIKKVGGIVQLEAVNAVHALSCLLPVNPNGYKIKLVTDNQATQLVLSKGKGKDRTLNACSRQLWLIAAKANTEIEVVHLAGTKMKLADALSRPQDKVLEGKAVEWCLKEGLKRVNIIHKASILSSQL